MKCQKCNKTATFHITDLTGDGLLALHLCPDCAKHYLQPEPDASDADTPKITGVLSEQLKLEQTAEELKELDSKKCPICDISFKEFRQAGRLGCPHDYVYFGTELKPLLESVHGKSQHVGKRPQRGAYDPESQTELIKLRGAMKLAVSRENYEKAKEIRDRIRSIEDQS